MGEHISTKDKEVFKATGLFSRGKHAAPNKYKEALEGFDFKKASALGLATVVLATSMTGMAEAKEAEPVVIEHEHDSYNHLLALENVDIGNALSIEATEDYIEIKEDMTPNKAENGRISENSIFRELTLNDDGSITAEVVTGDFRNGDVMSVNKLFAKYMRLDANEEYLENQDIIGDDPALIHRGLVLKVTIEDPVFIEMKAGDTLSGIASNINDGNYIGAADLLYLMGISEEEARSLQVGTMVPIPMSAGESVTIEAGDTLSEIAEAYGTSVEELATINNIENIDMIYAGTELKTGRGLAIGSETVLSRDPEEEEIRTVEKPEDSARDLDEVPKEDLPEAVEEILVESAVPEDVVEEVVEDIVEQVAENKISLAAVEVAAEKFEESGKLEEIVEIIEPTPDIFKDATPEQIELLKSKVQTVNEIAKNLDFDQEKIAVDELVTAISEMYSAFSDFDTDRPSDLPDGYVKIMLASEALGLEIPIGVALKTHDVERYTSPVSAAVFYAQAELAKSFVETAIANGELDESWSNAGLRLGDAISPNGFHVTHDDEEVDVRGVDKDISTVDGVSDGYLIDKSFGDGINREATINFLVASGRMTYKDRYVFADNGHILYSDSGIVNEVNSRLGFKVVSLADYHHDHIHQRPSNRVSNIEDHKPVIEEEGWDKEVDLRIGSEFKDLPEEAKEEVHGDVEHFHEEVEKHAEKIEELEAEAEEKAEEEAKKEEETTEEDTAEVVEEVETTEDTPDENVEETPDEDAEEENIEYDAYTEEIERITEKVKAEVASLPVYENPYGITPDHIEPPEEIITADEMAQRGIDRDEQGLSWAETAGERDDAVEMSEALVVYGGVLDLEIPDQFKKPGYETSEDLLANAIAAFLGEGGGYAKIVGDLKVVDGAVLDPTDDIPLRDEVIQMSPSTIQSFWVANSKYDNELRDPELVGNDIRIAMNRAGVMMRQRIAAGQDPLSPWNYYNNKDKERSNFYGHLETARDAVTEIKNR